MYPGAYAAKSVQVRPDGRITAYVPQLFGDTIIVIGSFTGSTPPGGEMGWVVFQSGDPEFPVWISGVADTTQAELAALQSEIGTVQSEVDVVQSEVDVVQESTTSLEELTTNTQKLMVVQQGNSDLSIPNNAYTAVTYNTLTLNLDGWHPGGTAGAVTPDIPGWYLINSWVQLNGISNACRFVHVLNVDNFAGAGNAGPKTDLNLSTISNTSPDTCVSAHLHFNGTEALSVAAYQNNGAAALISNARLSVQLVRPD